MKRKRSKQVLNESRLTTFFEHLDEDLEVADPSNPAVVRLRERCRKKASYNRRDLEADAYETFIKTNELVGSFKPTDVGLFSDMREFITHVLEKAVRSFDPTSIQECFSLSWILDNWAFGPGASNGVPGVGCVQKIDEPMTCTRSAEPYVRLLRRTNPYFWAKDALTENQGVSCVEGSRLKAVPKNEDAVRIIAIEPSGNMALQLGAASLIELALRRIGLDISRRSDINKDLARHYSLTGDGATLDLSKASDMFSIDLIRLTWPAEWFNFFMKVRSPQTTLPDGRVVKLNMMSTMGNGCTFPMMTLTLVAMIYASRRRRGGPYKFIELRKTSVFGDDIIIPSSDFHDVCEALQQCGLVVNYDKSYNSGPFRESCGGDFHAGRDITPIYVKTLAAPAGVYVAINQCLRWSANHDVWLVRSLKYLRTLLGSRVYFVPQWLDDTSGVKTLCVNRRYKHLSKVPKTCQYSGSFSVPLASGGYLRNGWDGGLAYNPRDEWVVYRTSEARLPRGYLDGWDPRYGTPRFASIIQLMVELLM